MCMLDCLVMNSEQTSRWVFMSVHRLGCVYGKSCTWAAIGMVSDAYYWLKMCMYRMCMYRLGVSFVFACMGVLVSFVYICVYVNTAISIWSYVYCYRIWDWHACLLCMGAS